MTVPVIIASMAKPFADAVQLHGHDPAPMQKQFGIDATRFGDDDVYIPVQAWYDFAEAVSDLLVDPYIGFRIGYGHGIDRLPNLSPVQAGNAALGEIYTALIIDTRRILAGITYQLTVDASVAQVQSKRSFYPINPPKQIDGFFAGFMLRIFREHISEPWKRVDLVITICEPNSIPAEEHLNSIFQKGDRTGAHFRFPAEWLLMRRGGTSPNATVGQERLDTDFLNRLHGILRSQLNDPALSVNKVARQIAIPTRQFQLRLSKLGTNYTQELKSLRLEAACRMLSDDEIRIAAVGEAVGIPDATAFSRAFRSWTKFSPRQYRNEKASNTKV